MTRAKEDLELIVPHRFYVHGQPRNGDRHVLAARTRFLPASTLNHFTQFTWPPLAATPIAPAREGPKVDLKARMRAMWG